MLLAVTAALKPPKLQSAMHTALLFKTLEQRVGDDKLPVLQPQC